MPAITNFDITYGTALAPAGYHRVTLQDGGSANLTKSDASKQSFLWYSDNPGKSAPILEVSVLYDDEPVPAGWDKVPRTLSKSTVQSAYLCYKRSATAAGASTEEPTSAGENTHQLKDELLPLGEVVIAYGDSVPMHDPSEKGNEEPWQQVSRSLDPVSQGVYLWWRRVRADEQAAWTPYQLRVGDLVDARDRTGQWCAGEIVTATADSVTVHYAGWQSSWDDVISRVGTKLAPRGTHTASKDTRAQRQVGMQLALNPTEVDAMRDKVREAASGHLEAAAAEKVLTEGLPQLVETCMISTFSDPQEAVPPVNDLLQLALDVVICAIVDHCTSLSATMLQLLAQLGDCDTRCQHYYRAYGYATVSSAACSWPAPDPPIPGLPAHNALPKEGQSRLILPPQLYYGDAWHGTGISVTSAATRTNSLLHANLAHFEARGGYAAILARLEAAAAAAAAAQRSGASEAGAADSSSKQWQEDAQSSAAAVAPCTLADLTVFVRFLEAGKLLYAEGPAREEYFEKFRALAFDRMDHLTLEELKEVSDGGPGDSFAKLNEIMDKLTKLLPHVLAGFDHNEALEKVNLSLSLQLLACPFLGPRIRGITILCESLTKATRLDRDLTRSRYSADSLQNTWLCDWLTTNKVIELVLGDPACAPSARPSRPQRKGSYLGLAAAARASYEEQGSSSAGDTTAGTSTAAAAAAAAAGGQDVAAAAACLPGPPSTSAQSSPRMLPPVPLNRVLSGALSAKPSLAHVEILKRSEKVLLFAVRYGLLTERHIDLLWAAAGAEADAQQRVVYGLLSGLGARLDGPGLRRVCHHLCALPPQLDEAQVDLIRDCAGSAARSARSANAAASDAACLQQLLDLLWRAVQEEAPVAPAVADAASAALARVLHNADHKLEEGAMLLEPAAAAAGVIALPQKREGLRMQALRRLLAQCIENVRAGRSVAASLLLLRRLTDSQPQAPTTHVRVTCCRLLTDLEQQEKLMGMVVADLVAYRGRAADALAMRQSKNRNRSSTALEHASAGPAAAGTAVAAAAPSVMAQVFEGRHTHEEQVSARLDFLVYIAEHAVPEMPYEAIAELWSCFVLRPLCPEEREPFFRWLHRMVPKGLSTHASRLSGIYQTCSVPTLTAVFTELLCSPSLDWSTLGLSAYECLSQFFIFVNLSKKALETDPHNSKALPVVLALGKLQGLPALWRVCLGAGDDAVASATGNFLIGLHVCMKSKDAAALTVDLAAAYDCFQKQCLDTMRQAAAGGAGGSDSARVQRRSIVLLDKFLFKALDHLPHHWHEDINQPADRSLEVAILVEFKARTGRGNLRNVQIRLRRGASPRYGPVTVGQLRAFMADWTKVPAHRIQLKSTDFLPLKAGIDDHRPVGNSSHIYDSFQASALVEPCEETQGWRPPPHATLDAYMDGANCSDPHYTIASHPVYFPQLYELLLASDTAVVELAWDLLNKLPINNAMKHELKCLGGHLVVPSDELAAKAVSLNARENGGFPGWDKTAVSLNGISSSSGTKSGPVPWSTLLSGASVPQLLYRLRIVLSLLDPAKQAWALPGDRADALAWQAAFIKRGGVAHVVHLLTAEQELQLDPKLRLHRACLASLLKLIIPSTVHGGRSRAASGTTARATRGRPAATPNSDSDSDDGVAAVTAAGGNSADEEEAEAELAALQLQAQIAELFTGIDHTALMQRLLSLMAAVSSTEPPTAGAAAAPAATLTAAIVSRRKSASVAADSADQQLPPEAEVVQHTMTLLGALTQHDPSLLNVILSFEGLPETLRYGLLRASESAVRSTVAGGVRRMAAAAPAALPFFTKLLLESLPLALQLEGGVCFEYFQLLAMLIAEEEALSAADRSAVCVQLAQAIASRPTVEANEDTLEVDMPLRGCMALLKQALLPCTATQRAELCTLIGAPPSDGGLDLVSVLFEQCLFALPHRLNPPSGNADSSSSASPGSSSSGVASGAAAAVAAAAAAEGEGLPLSSAIQSATEDQSSGPHPPKCKHADTRHIAYKLLSEVAQGSTACLARALALAAPHHSVGLTQEQRERSAQQEARRRSRKQSGAATASAAAVAAAVTGGQHSLLRTSSFLGAASAAGGGSGRQASGYCGLKNLGCICYMNSTLQQLFMVPSFRAAVLAFDGEADVPVEEREDSLMWQLQCLFAHLQESEKSYYNPRGFCTAYKDWDGEPTDVLVQQDASEFVIQFLQQLEGRVMGSPSEGMLRESFGGVFCNELLADGGRRSEQPEVFSYISVVVKDQRSLDEALGKVVAGEVVDYKWEDTTGSGAEPQQLPTLKRTSVKELPQHLIIHLKRFDFDFNLMQQVKINDRFEFPLELDMRPYTCEGLAEKEEAEAKAAAAAAAAAAAGSNAAAESATSTDDSTDDSGGAAASNDAGGSSGEIEPASDAPASKENTGPAGRRPEYYKYQLAGVVVHMGTANSGHYYSYIRERNSSDWFEFNDTVVCPFDPKEIEVECFGGDEAQRSAGNTAFSRERIRNAFMLVYDRIPAGSSSSSSAAANGTAVTAAAGAATTAGDDGAAAGGATITDEPAADAAATALVPSALPQVSSTRKSSAAGRFRARVPPAIMEEIFLENIEFWRKRNILQQEYYNFMRDLVLAAPQMSISSGSTELLLQAVQLAVNFVLGTLVQANESTLVTDWCSALKEMLPQCPAACSWLLSTLAEDPAALQDLTLSARHCCLDVAALLGAAIRLDASVTAAAAAAAPASTQALLESSAAGKLVLSLLRSASELQPNSWKHLDPYFHMVQQLLEGGGSAATALLLEKGALPLLLTVLMGQDMAPTKPGAPLDFLHDGSGLVNLLSRLLKASDMSALHAQLLAEPSSDDETAAAPLQHSPSPYAEQPGYPLPEEAVQLLATRKLWLVLLKEMPSRPRSSSLGLALRHVVWGSFDTLVLITSALCSAVQQENDFAGLKPFFRSFCVLLSTNSSRSSSSRGAPPAPAATAGHEHMLQWATAYAMDQLLTAVASQKDYSRATEACATLLLRVAKASPLAHAWLRANTGHPAVDYLVRFLAHRDQVGLARAAQALDKPGWPLLSSRSSGFGVGPDRVDRGAAAVGPVSMAVFRDMLLKDERLTHDSDDEMTDVIGQRVRVRWGQKQVTGSVIGFQGNKHVVQYDSDSSESVQHKHDLLQTAFFFLPPDESDDSESDEDDEQQLQQQQQQQHQQHHHHHPRYE